MTDSRRTPPPWPEQPLQAQRYSKRSEWVILGWIVGALLLFCGLAYLGLLLLATVHFNTVGGNK